MSPSAQPSSDASLGSAAAEAQARRAALLVRLRRLHGQADGIARMIETDRLALDVLQQLGAFIAAAREASVEYAAGVLRDELASHIDDQQDLEQALVQLRAVIERAARLP